VPSSATLAAPNCALKVDKGTTTSRTSSTGKPKSPRQRAHCKTTEVFALPRTTMFCLAFDTRTVPTTGSVSSHSSLRRPVGIVISRSMDAPGARKTSNKSRCMIAISPFGFYAKRKTQKTNAKLGLCVATAFPAHIKRTNKRRRPDILPGYPRRGQLKAQKPRLTRTGVVIVLALPRTPIRAISRV
jgi:hypothetical protein